MAKPTWITIVGSGSATGSGSTTRSLKASAHTGRSSRSGSIKGTTTGGAVDTVSIVQSGVTEFINVDEVNYSATALGGSITISGTSNSPSLKISSLSNSSQLSGWSLKVNKSSVTWNGSTKHLISGDPGAAATYSFEISVTVAENKTESKRSITFEITDSGSKPTSGTITISQAAGVKTYGTETVYFSYTTFKIPASGGKTELSYSFSIPWGWNGKTNSGKLTQADTKHSLSFAYIDEEPSSPFNWSLNESTGQVTMGSLGKNITSGSGVVHIKMTIDIPSINKSYTATDYVRQEGNSVSYTLFAVGVSHKDIPASGGSANSPILQYASGFKNYSSGDHETIDSIPESEINITLSKTVNASSLGTTIKSRTKLDTVTATVTWNGVTETQSLDIYQEANAVISYSGVSATSQSFTVAKTGGSFSVKDSPSQKKTFTSGSSLDITDFEYSFSGIPAYVTVDELALTATVDKNRTGSSRNNFISVTITGENKESKTITISFSQASCAIPYWNAPSTYTFDSNGQGDSPYGIEITVTDPDNVGWTVDGPSYMDHSDSSGRKFPYYGSGTTTLYLSPGNYTGTTQREFALYLISYDGTSRLCRCECVQSAATVVEDTVTLGLGISGPDSILDFSSGYPNVIISPFGNYADASADYVSLGKMSEPNSVYANVDVVKSNLSILKSKLSGDWNKYSYLYIIVVGGTTTGDIVYDSEISEWTYYDNENFCLCEINRIGADFDAIVDSMIGGTDYDITSDYIQDEYSTKSHVIFKASTGGESIINVLSCQEFDGVSKVALYLNIDVDTGTIDTAIYPLRKAILSTLDPYMCEMYIYRMLPLPQTVLRINEGHFETTQSAPEELTVFDMVNIGFTAGGSVIENQTPFQGDTYLSNGIDDNTRGCDFLLEGLDIRNYLTAGDIIVTIDCGGSGDSFAELT